MKSSRRLSPAAAAVAAASLVFAAVPAHGATTCPRTAPVGVPDVVTLSIENDKVVGTDRNFTNGVRLSWLSAANDVPGWACRVAEAVPFLLDPGGLYHVGFAAGHNIYTPADTSRSDLIVDDRPYAAWLYAGVIFVSDTGPTRDKTRTATLETLEIDLGIVGPSAQGRWVQNEYHRLLGVDAANGWDNQLEDEPGIMIAYERKWRNWRPLSETRFGLLGVDAIPHVSGSLGNVYTYAGLGGVVRLGQGLEDDYGPPRIRPSLPGSAYFRNPGGFSWYIFAGAEGRVVVRDIFLDGNTFRDSHSVDKEPLVGELQFGLAILVGGVRLSYTHVMRSREFEGQDDAHQFGALGMSVRF